MILTYLVEEIQGIRFANQTMSISSHVYQNVMHLTEDEAGMMVKIEALSFFDNALKTSHKVTNQMREQHYIFSIITRQELKKHYQKFCSTAFCSSYP